MDCQGVARIPVPAVPNLASACQPLHLHKSQQLQCNPALCCMCRSKDPDTPKEALLDSCDDSTDDVYMMMIVKLVNDKVCWPA